jgi:hypothetical protein
VLISGLTVMIAMAGMFLAGSIVFESFAVGTILVVAVAATDVTAPAVQQGIKAMTDRALATGQMSEPVSTTTSPAKSVEVVSIPRHGNGTDKTSEAALAGVRERVILTFTPRRRSASSSTPSPSHPPSVRSAAPA